MNKIIFLFCFAFISFVQVKANSGQNPLEITIRFENQSLDSALHQLEKVSKYRFIYQDKIDNQLISGNFNGTLPGILDVLFRDTKNSYVILGVKVIIYKKQEFKSETFTITGKVVDEEGIAIPGATIRIKGEDMDGFTITKMDGSFVISTTNTNAYLIISFIGCLPRVVSIKDAGLIKLEQDPVSLNEVIRIN